MHSLLACLYGVFQRRIKEQGRVGRGIFTRSLLVYTGCSRGGRGSEERRDGTEVFTFFLLVVFVRRAGGLLPIFGDGTSRC